MKLLKKTIIFSLVFLLGFSSIPVFPGGAVLAESISLENQDPLPPKEGKIEIVSKRTKNSKTFLKSDGTKELVAYQGPIHFETEEMGKKKWEEIDYSLSEKDSVFGTLLGNEFKNKRNDFKLSISKNIAKKAFSLEKDGTEISISISEIKSKGTNTLDKNALKLRSYEQKDNRVTFKNVTPGVDFSFYSMSDGIKEYITINKYTGQSEFSFEITIKNGYVLSDADGAYKIYNAETKKEVFTMPRFFMWDSKGGKDSPDNEYSYSVKTKLVDLGKNQYKLTVTADEKWLSDKSRVFPVYLDPSYSTYSAEDTYVQSGYPTTRAWDQRALYVGVGATKGVNRALVKFDLPDLRGARIDYAQFDVYQYGNCSGSCTWSNVNAYTTGWFNPRDVYWYNQPGLWSYVGTARQTAAYGWYSVAITGAAQQWFPDWANYGGSYNGALAFYQSVENSWGYRTWASRNNPDYSWGQPKLTINYNDYNAYYEPTTVAEGIAATTIDVPIVIQNRGRLTWYKGGANPTKIGYHLVNNATGEEIMWDSLWSDLPYDVSRGSWVTAIAKVKLPPISGSYTIKYDLVHTGVTWFSQQGVSTANRTINVYPPSFASMRHLGQEPYYAMAGPVDLVNGNLSYSSTDLVVPSNMGGVSISRSYNSNRNFQTFNHDANGYIRKWLFNGPYKENDQTWRLAREYISNESLLRPNEFSVSKNNVWLGAEEPTTSQMWLNWVFYGLGAYQVDRATNVAAYAHVYIYSPDTRTVQLRLGSDDGIKVWLNSNLVHLNDVYRGLTLDSDVKNVTLNAGWNSLLVKTSQGGGGWQMSARFLSASGAVMNDLKYSLNNPELFEKTGVLGQNWIASFEENLFTLNSEDIYYRDSSGTVNQYLATGNGNYTKPAGTDLELTKTASNYILTAKDGSQKLFDLSGRLLEVRDLSGNSTRYHYDENSKVASIENSGRKINLNYNSNGTLASVSNAAGQSIAYNYENDRLSRVIDNDGYSYKYTYDAEGRITEYKDKKDNPTKFEYAGGKVSKIIDALGNATSFNYEAAKTIVTDAKGRKSTYTFDSANLISSFTNAKGYGEKYIHDKRYNRVQMFPDINSSDPYYYRYQYTYDTNDNLLTETDPLGAVTTYQYNGNDLVKITDPKGGIVEKTYSTDGRRLLLSEKDAEGNITRYEYDALGRRIATISPKGERSTGSYNEFGDLVSATTPKGETTTFVYDEVGRKTKDISPLGKENIYEYDSLSRLVRLTAPGDLVTRYEYDPNGNKIKEINPNDTFKTWQYDALDRVVRQIDEAGAETRYEYDAVGNKVKQIDAKGKATAYEYDELNQMIKETDVTGQAASVAYDRNGNATTVIDPKGTTTSQAYDKAGQLISETKPEGTTALTYDKNGNVINITNPKETVSINYNKNDDPTLESSTLTGNVTRTYDANQEQTKVETTNAKTEFVYDANGQVSQVKNTVTAVATGIGGGCEPGQYCPQVVIPTISGAANFARDAEGKLTEVGKANGDVVSFGYDIAGRVNSITTTNKNGAILASFAYEYDKASNQTKITDWRGRVFNYSYDARNQLTGDNLAQYKYDVIGNRTEMITAEGTVRYYYDDAAYGNRLTKVEYSNGRTITFEYDKNGNATKKVDSVKGTTLYKYDSEDYFVEAVLPDGTKVEYVYDEVSKRRAQRKITKPDGVTEVLKFTFDGEKLMTETDANGKVVRSYTWDEDENLISVAMPDAAGTLKYFYFVKNAKGDVVGLSDESGNLVAEYEYDSWGNILKAETLDSSLGENFAKNNPRLYGSYWYDEVLSQYFMKTRMYDPELGRFYSQDPLETGEDALSQNPYIYVENNPIIKIDPDGKIAFVPLLVMGASVAFQAWCTYDDIKTLKNKNAPKADKAWAAFGLAATVLPGDEFIRGGIKGLRATPKVVKGVTQKAISSTKITRSISVRNSYLKDIANKSPKYMKQWTTKGKVPPGYSVHHNKPLYLGGKDLKYNMRLVSNDLHKVKTALWRKITKRR